MSSISPSALTTMTGTSGRTERTRLSTSSPLPSGSTRSRRMRSKSYVVPSPMASAAVAARSTACPSAVSPFTTNEAMLSSSSTTRMRTLVLSVGPIARALCALVPFFRCVYYCFFLLSSGVLLCEPWDGSLDSSSSLSLAEEACSSSSSRTARRDDLALVVSVAVRYLRLSRGPQPKRHRGASLEPMRSCRLVARLQRRSGPGLA